MKTQDHPTTKQISIMNVDTQNPSHLVRSDNWLELWCAQGTSKTYYCMIVVYTESLTSPWNQVCGALKSLWLNMSTWLQRRSYFCYQAKDLLEKWKQRRYIAQARCSKWHAIPIDLGFTTFAFINTSRFLMTRWIQTGPVLSSAGQICSPSQNICATLKIFPCVMLWSRKTCWIGSNRWNTSSYSIFALKELSNVQFFTSVYEQSRCRAWILLSHS